MKIFILLLGVLLGMSDYASCTQIDDNRKHVVLLHGLGRSARSMNKIEEFVCDCTECVAMCRKFPCRPLPEEVDEMPPEVRARLMIQREGDCLSGVPHLAAGAVGFEGEGAPDFEVFFGSIGKPHTCTFLTDGLCELHGKCKPFEGRTAHHAQKHSTYGVLRDAWDTEEGAATLARWEREAAS